MLSIENVLPSWKEVEEMKNYFWNVFCKNAQCQSNWKKQNKNSRNVNFTILDPSNRMMLMLWAGKLSCELYLICWNEINTLFSSWRFFQNSEKILFTRLTKFCSHCASKLNLCSSSLGSVFSTTFNYCHTQFTYCKVLCEFFVGNIDDCLKLCTYQVLQWSKIFYKEELWRLHIASTKSKKEAFCLLTKIQLKLHKKLF